MVDQGGLDYRIAVEDQFSSTTQRFRDELASSTEAWRRFVSSVRSGATELGATRAAIAQATRAAKAALKVSQDQAVASERRAKALTIEQEAQKRAAKTERERLVVFRQSQILAQKGIALSARSTKSLSLEARGTLALAAAKDRLAVAAERDRQASLEGISLSKKKIEAFNAELAAAKVQARAEQKILRDQALARRGLGPSGLPLEAPEIPKTIGQLASERVQKRIKELEETLEFKKLAKGNPRLKELERELGVVDGVGNRISFTFRRLFGIFAAFTAARVLARFFRDLVVEGVRFNAQVETSILSIASLVTATADVRDATGEAVDKSRQLALAQAEARRQVALLRLDALRTAGTFEDLLDAFQVAIAPGITAGLNLDEIRKLTVQISQAAAAIGVPQNQLAEEIRSLLQGTIQLRTTRIAAALGITNEDIRRAKELGQLTGFLNDRFQAFTRAGEESLKTFDVILSNVRDAIRQLLGAGAIDLFESLKGLLSDVQKSIVRIKDEGVLLDPEAVQVVREVGRGIASVVDEARRLGSALSFSDLRRSAELAGAALRVSAKLLGGIVEGFVRGARVVAEVLGRVVELLRQGASVAEKILPEGTFRRALVVATQILTVFGGLLLASKATLVASRALLLPYTALVALSSRWVRLIAEGRAGVVALVGSLRTAAVAARALTAVLSIGAVLGIQVIVDKIRETLKLPEDVSLTIGAFFEVNFVRLVTLIELVFATVDKGLEDLKAKALETVADVGSAIGLLSDAAAENLRGEALGIQIAAALEFQQRMAAIFAQENKSLAEIREKLIANQKPQEEQTKQATKLSDILENLPAAIGRSREGLDQMQETLKRVREDALDARDAFRGVVGNLGVQGGILEQRQALLEASVRLRKDEKQLVTEQRQAEQALLDVRREARDLALQVRRLETDQGAAVAKGVEAGKKVLEIQSKLSRLETERALAEAEREAAQKRGDQRALIAAKQKEQSLRQQVSAENELLKSILAQADQILTGFDPEVAERVRELVSQTLTLAGRESVAAASLRDIEADRLELRQRIFDVARETVQAVAAREAFELSEGNRQLALQVAAQRRLLELRRSILETFDDRPLREQLVDAQNLVEVERQRLTLLREQADRELSRLDLVIEEANRAGQLTEVNHLLDQRAALERRIRLEQAEQAEKLDELQRKLEALNRSLQAPATAGFAKAIADFVRSAPDDFQTALSVMRSALDGFVALGGQAFRSLFDPRAAQDLEQAFANFLLDIAQQIAESQIRKALAQLVSGLGVGEEITASQQQAAATTMVAAAGLWAPVAAQIQAAAATLLLSAQVLSSGGLGAFGLARGGRVPRRGPPPSPAHRTPRARGFHRGRPRGISPRDTVPAWLEPGEWVVRRESVLRYGEDVMDRINRGLADPTAMRALAGARPARTSAPKPARGPGFASGGSVPRATQAAQASRGPQIATLVPGEQTLERLLAGGKPAMRRYMQEDAAFLRGLLER